jgi:hypothetical protein
LRPLRQRSARESPAFAVMMWVGVTITAMAVHPLISFIYTRGLKFVRIRESIMAKHSFSAVSKLDTDVCSLEEEKKIVVI